MAIDGGGEPFPGGPCPFAPYFEIGREGHVIGVHFELSHAHFFGFLGQFDDGHGAGEASAIELFAWGGSVGIDDKSRYGLIG